MSGPRVLVGGIRIHSRHRVHFLYRIAALPRYHAETSLSIPLLPSLPLPLSVVPCIRIVVEYNGDDECLPVPSYLHSWCKWPFSRGTMSIPNVFTLDTRETRWETVYDPALSRSLSSSSLSLLLLSLSLLVEKRVNRRRFMAGFTAVDPLIVFRCMAVLRVSRLICSRLRRSLAIVSKNDVAFLSWFFLCFFFFFFLELQGVTRRMILFQFLFVEEKLVLCK